MTACAEETEGIHTKQKALQGVVIGLASELSTCWASSCASPELSAALIRLLPNLKYCRWVTMRMSWLAAGVGGVAAVVSPGGPVGTGHGPQPAHVRTPLTSHSVAVLNPASGTLVSSSNFASPGPTTLRVLEPAHSLAGLCLAARRPLSTGLEQRAEGDESGTLVWHLDDVQAMLAESEEGGSAAGCEIRHLLCVPFGAAGAAEAEALRQQQRQQRQGGQVQAHHHEGRGAIVLGFPSRPELSPRHVHGRGARRDRRP